MPPNITGGAGVIKFLICEPLSHILSIGSAKLPDFFYGNNRPFSSPLVFWVCGGGLKKTNSDGRRHAGGGRNKRPSGSGPAKNRNGNRGSGASAGKPPSRPAAGFKKPFKRGAEPPAFFVAKAVSGPEGMRLMPRKEDFPYALVSGKSEDGTKLRNGYLAFVKYTGKKHKDLKETVPLVTVEKIIGRAGEFETEKKAIEYKYSLSGGFPEEVLKQAEQVSLMRPSDNVEGRVDLRKETIFTIDGDDAKDYDDAVGIRKKGSGFALRVCIADVSHYVSKGSPLDREAMRRCTSVYLDNRVIPMLPEALSNDLCSLVPEQDRLTKTVEMEFTADGVLGDFHVYNSIIRSAARLTYSQVTEFLEKGKDSQLPSDVKNGLRMMKDLYAKIKKRSLAGGELDFDLPEPEIVRDNEGRVTAVQNARRGIANMVIEQFMIAANKAVGMRLCESANCGVYRIHEPPTGDSISELASDLEKLGYRFEVSNRSLGGAIQRLLDDFKGKKQESAVKMMVLRSLQRAVYSTREVGHFGLAIERYSHFTSPIRRYPDIVAHRMIDFLTSGGSEYCGKTVDGICERASVLERNAEKAERETVGLETANFMKTLTGQTLTGTVISILPFGMFVELREVCAEGFVPRERMRGGGRRKWFNLGQELKLRVVGADLERRRTVMEPA